MQKTFQKILKKITPSKKEILENQKIFNEISDFIRKKYKMVPKLMGSVAKNTFLKGDKDLDIFLFFSPSTTRKKLEKDGLKIGKDVFRKFKGKYVIEYAEHPYTKGKIKDFSIEIVPAYAIKDTKKIQSAVDRTPFHTKYVLENLKNNNEVRLFKKFLKGIGCYGSDLKTQGFSGYLCELLIIKYKTFKKVMELMQNWRYQEIIELSQPKQNFNKLKKMFKDQPLIVIDPVDKKRNVAAVLSREKLAKSIFYARKFMEKPSISYFISKPKPVNKQKILKNVKQRGTDTIVIIFKKPAVIEDILYPQLRRFEKVIVKKLKSEGFILLDSWVFGDNECGVGIELLSTKLPKYKVIIGPSIFMQSKHQDAFVKKYKKVWFVDDRFVAEVERKHKDLEGFIKNLLKGNAAYLQLSGIPSNIAKIISKKFDVITDIRKIKSHEFWQGLEKEIVK